MTSNTSANAFSASVLPVGTQTPGSNTAKSLVTPPGTAPSTIPQTMDTHVNGVNKVMVIFKSGTSAEDIKAAEDDVLSQGGKITQRYTTALLGFAAELPDNTLQALTVHPQLDYIEPDGIVTAYAQSLLKN
ncbi:hypothetical protein BC939DRAFT_524876 [Gamsiella multidivaricata]|uniref:uncharacterized protein n=1 Tax=Gamsiella multidivaricata TaxID=101098 RepID=UPI0022212AFC|nr:uncharacterized protein BC939DRAFT_524876 [Gamsiella multidivaricata]KAG0364536.1 hypothetical protein BGZ54_007403 [Gamsiella multidivaricata]KAI7831759.1 hypothetical protein BC939DRAFT_524876 [Gamsiella multidivaricata]